MRKFSETNGHLQWGTVPDPLADSPGDGGMTEVRGFGFNPGALRMLTYRPKGLAAGAPLVVVLHGCTQRAGGYARGSGWLALADRLGFTVLAPEQTSENNPNRCFNWFEPGDIARGAGEAASIHAMVQRMVASDRLDPARVFVTGLSAGGAMTTVLLAAYPDVFAAGAVVAGLPFGLATNVQEAFAAMRGSSQLSGAELARLVAAAAPAVKRPPRLAIWHGQADGTVSIRNARTLALQWASLHGLGAQPDGSHRRSGWSRSVWRSEDGEALVEMNLLAGLGHGTPIAAGGADPIGRAAPYILEAGVSSSLEIARFWGIAPADVATLSGDDGWLPSDAAAPPPAADDSLGERVMASVTPHVSDDVRQVIADALIAAGLRR